MDNHRRRIGRYRENLGEAQLRDVVAVCGDLLEELGYACRAEAGSEDA